MASFRPREYISGPQRAILSPETDLTERWWHVSGTLYTNSALKLPHLRQECPLRMHISDRSAHSGCTSQTGVPTQAAHPFSFLCSHVLPPHSDHVELWQGQRRQSVNDRPQGKPYRRGEVSERTSLNLSKGSRPFTQTPLSL